ncbi:MAG: hypothetical protein KatS3mg131_2123 [Candidatus Tectimicrobiota bacterium]|nr:MAG: hypothetical protein KatS3mg131_2123 [Candidatus Tectomicrobia bacterium]
MVDASLLGAVAFQEPWRAEAIALLAYALASIVRKKALRYPAFARELLEALEDALALDIRWREADHRGLQRMARRAPASGAPGGVP